MNVWNAIIELVTCKDAIIHVASASVIYQATCALCSSDDQAWFRVASKTSIRVGSRKHQIASLHTTSGWRHEYCISAFHKVHCYLLLLHSKLTTLDLHPLREHPNWLVGFSCLFCLLRHEKWMLEWPCSHDWTTLIVHSAISLALLKCH